MRILVTGGAGFIGSHAVRRFLADGHRVVVLDDLSTGHRTNLDRLDVSLIVGDIRDRGIVDEAMRGADRVLHLAGFVSVPGSIADPVTSHAVNVDGTRVVLDSARASGSVGRLAFASSAAVYGDTTVVPIREETALDPLSPYGEQKRDGEILCREAARAGGTFDTVVFRFFNVYGARQSPDSDYAAVIPIFRDRCARCLAPRVFGDGTQTRDFIHVGDVVEGIARAFASPERFEGRAFNLARGESTTVEELARAVAAAEEVALDPEFTPARPGDIEHSVADITRLRTAFGWAPATDLATGLTLCAE